MYDDEYVLDILYMGPAVITDTIEQMFYFNNKLHT